MAGPSGLLAVRGYIFAAGIVAVTAVGAITGAQLKSSVQDDQRRAELRSASPEDLISTLEFRIGTLAEKRDELQAKISGLDAKIAEKARLKAEARERAKARASAGDGSQ